jgi:hypothetical protein
MKNCTGKFLAGTMCGKFSRILFYFTDMQKRDFLHICEIK